MLVFTAHPVPKGRMRRQGRYFLRRAIYLDFTAYPGPKCPKHRRKRCFLRMPFVLIFTQKPTPAAVGWTLHRKTSTLKPPTLTTLPDPPKHLPDLAFNKCLEGTTLSLKLGPCNQ